MATLRTAIQIYDGMSPALRSMNTAMNIVINSFESMQNVSNNAVNTASLQLAREELARSAAALDQLENNVKNVRDSAENATGSFKGWQKAIIVANQALGLIKSTLGSLGVFDLDKAFDRMDTMTNFKRTMGAILGDANATTWALGQLKENTLGTAYGLDVAAKATQNFVTRGMGIKSATEETRKWADAVAFYGQGTNDQFKNVVDALGKMVSKGKVEMSQLDRITDAGINAVGIYAQATGRMAGAVQKDLSAGTISARDFITTVSTAMDEGINGVLKISGAAKEAGAIWATTFANMKAAIARGWVEAIERVDQVLVASGMPSTMQIIQKIGSVFENLIKIVSKAAYVVIPLVAGIATVFGIAFSIVKWSIEAVMSVFNLFANIFIALMPTILTLLATYAAYWVSVMAIEKAVAAVKALLAGRTLAVAAAQTVLEIKTKAAAAAQFILELRTKSITVAQAAWTVVTQGLTTAIGLLNKAIRSNPISILITIVAIIIAAFVLWAIKTQDLRQVFSDVFGAIVDIVEKAINFIIDKINFLISGFNAIGGFVGKILGFEYGGIAEIQYKADFSGFKAKGQDLIQNLTIEDIKNKLTGAFNLDIGDIYNNNGASYHDDLMDNVADIAGDTAKMKNKMDLAEEDLKYMRDIDERKAISKFTTAEINVSQIFNNEISADSNLDGIMARWTEDFNDAIIASAEGVHA